jgi:hypothetical protein
LVKEEKEKACQVFQHIVQLQKWGAFGFIAAEVEMKRLYYNDFRLGKKRASFVVIGCSTDCFDLNRGK